MKTSLPTFARSRRSSSALLLGSSLLLASISHIGLGQRIDRHAQPAYLGINTRDIAETELGFLKLKDAHGVEVVLVDHDGPAFRSGLREHDVLIQINGLPVDSGDQLRRLMRDIPAGRTITLSISRDGQPQTFSAQLANRNTVGQEAWERHITVPEPAAPSSLPGPEPESKSRGFMGGTPLTASDLNRAGVRLLNPSYTGAQLELMGPQLAEFFGAQTGLLVHEVEPNSPAGLAGLRAGDVVVRINSLPIVAPADWLKTVAENRGHAVPVVVLRDRKEQTLTLTPDAHRRSSAAPRALPGAGDPVQSSPAMASAEPA